MGNEIRKAKRKLKKSASAVYYHTDPLPPPYHPPITASVTVSVPPPIPPPAPVVGVSVHPPVPVVGVSVPPPMHPPVPVVGFSVPPPMHPPVPVVGVSVPPGPSFMPPALGAVVGMAFAPGQWFPIDLPAVNVGLGWAFKPGDVYDLDTSVTGFDDRGVITESVYYSRKSGFNGAIRLSGDNTTGKGHGDDEVMYITLSRIPHNVRTLTILISKVNFFNSSSLSISSCNLGNSSNVQIILYISVLLASSINEYFSIMVSMILSIDFLSNCTSFIFPIYGNNCEKRTSPSLLFILSGIFLFKEIFSFSVFLFLSSIFLNSPKI